MSKKAYVPCKIVVANLTEPLLIYVTEADGRELVSAITDYQQASSAILSPKQPTGFGLLYRMLQDEPDMGLMWISLDKIAAVMMLGVTE